MVEKYSADSLRFGACASKLGEDVPFQEKELVAGQKMVTKLWNASRFVFMHIGKRPAKPKKLSAFDGWMLSEINGLVETSTNAFDRHWEIHIQ